MQADELLHDEHGPHEAPHIGAASEGRASTESAFTPPGEPAPLRRPRARRPFISPVVWAAAAVGAMMVCVGLVLAPEAVLIVAALVLGAALFWKSHARRSAGASVVPSAAVWAAVVALVVSVGALSVHDVIATWAPALTGSTYAPQAAATQAGPSAEAVRAASSAPTAQAPTRASDAASPSAPTTGMPPAAPSKAVPPPIPAAVPATAAPIPEGQIPVPPTAAAPPPLSTSQAAATMTPSYKNCGVVRSLGLQTILRGEPGYSLRLDRNGDGIACN